MAGSAAFPTLIGVGWTIFAALNGAIALAYVTIGVRIVPSLRIRTAGKVFGALFFLTCAGTHTDLAVHSLTDHPAFFREPHMWAIHGTQALVDWAFIYVVLLRPARHHRVRTPLAEAKGLSDVAVERPEPVILKALQESVSAALDEYDSVEEQQGRRARPDRRRSPAAGDSS